MEDEQRGLAAAEVAEVDWRALRPNLARDGIILVDPRLELAHVARRVAGDDAGAVAGWIEAGLLTKPSAAQVAAWEDAQDTPFRTVIVQPYVLAQRILA